jgi:hypothetical protein
MAKYDEVAESVKLWSYRDKLSLIEEIVRNLREELADENPVRKTSEELGWPPGYFERAYGIQRHDPIERPPQPEYQAREGL